MKLASVDQLIAGMVVVEDVYTPGENLLLIKGTMLDGPHIAALKKNRVRYVHVSNRIMIPSREAPIRIASDLAAVLPRPKTIITEELREKAVDSIEELFSSLTLAPNDLHASSTQVIKQIDCVVEQLVDALNGDKHTLINISDLKSHDEYTYHHSLSVAALSIAVGQRLGFDNNSLNDLGKASILHDIGKTMIPASILNKTSKLDAEEMRIIQTHPMAGYYHLLNNNVSNENILLGVSHHHEKIDGTGYPHGLKGDRISLFGRITAVGDVYDALTSNRPYRVPNQPAEAIEYIMGGIDAAFDYDIVQAFIQKLDPYPIGCFVRLSNGRSAVIVDNENQTRPIVRLLDTGACIDLSLDKIYRNVVIKGLLPEGAVLVED